MWRYAEVLLNYAEAKAELGSFSADDWIKTVGALRKRAGIAAAAAEALPVVADPYLATNYFPDISSNPVLLEIRRERGIELALEGFRLFDIRRWRIAEHVLPGNMLGRRHRARWFDAVTPTFTVHGKSQYPNETQLFQILSTNSFDPARHYLWPIPQREMDLNRSLVQNPGYN